MLISQKPIVVSPIKTNTYDSLIFVNHYRPCGLCTIAREFPCGYFVFVNILLCRHCPMSKGLSFVGILQDLAVSQTGYITRRKYDYNFTAHNPSM